MNKSWQVWMSVENGIPRFSTLDFSRKHANSLAGFMGYPKPIEFTLRAGPDPVPELLDALERIAAHDSTTCDGITPRDCVETMREIARAAIAKANGQQRTEKGT